MTELGIQLHSSIRMTELALQTLVRMTELAFRHSSGMTELAFRHSSGMTNCIQTLVRNDGIGVQGMTHSSKITN